LHDLNRQQQPFRIACVAFRSCTDTKNPAMFENTRVSTICLTKTAYFCG
jgi:hypothetical protein